MPGLPGAAELRVAIRAIDRCGVPIELGLPGVSLISRLRATRTLDSGIEPAIPPSLGSRIQAQSP